jgi:hypothetical protein
MHRCGGILPPQQRSDFSRRAASGVCRITACSPSQCFPASARRPQAREEQDVTGDEADEVPRDQERRAALA